MQMFKSQLMHLKECLNVSLTILNCIFIVWHPIFRAKFRVKWASHVMPDKHQIWMEEPQLGVWELHSTLFGFVWLNNAHNSKWLGGTLFKIVDWLGITHKVSVVFDLICIVDIFTHIKHNRLDTLLGIIPWIMTQWWIFLQCTSKTKQRHHICTRSGTFSVLLGVATFPKILGIIF